MGCRTCNVLANPRIWAKGDVVSENVYHRDASDRPILRAAVAAHVDILITGDKDFLEAGIATPHIMTAREFVQMEGG